MEHITKEQFHSNFKRNKYHASPRDYKGSKYDSNLEANHAELLDTLRRAKLPSQRVVKWKRQVKVSLDVNGIHVANYYVDFIVYFQDRHIEYHEVKSPITMTPVFKLKEKLFRALYPERKLIIIY